MYVTINIMYICEQVCISIDFSKNVFECLNVSLRLTLQAIEFSSDFHRVLKILISL